MTFDPLRTSKALCGWGIVFLLAAIVVFVFVDRESGWFLMAGASVNAVMGAALRGAGAVVEVER